MVRSPDNAGLLRFLERAEVTFGAFRAPAIAMLSEWEVSQEHCIMRDSVRFAFRHRTAQRGRGMVLVSRPIEAVIFADHHYAHGYASSFPIVIQQCIPDHGNIQVVHHATPIAWGSGAQVADTAQRFTVIPVPEYYGFLKPATDGDVKTPEGIIVDPSNIGEVLDLIRKAQAPEQQKIRERLNRNEAKLQLNAQVLTFAA